MTEIMNSGTACIDGFDRLGGVPGNEKSHFHPDLHK